MKGYRKLRVGEVIKQGDVFLDAYNNNKKESANFWAGTTIGDLHQDHYRPIKKQGKRYSYIARVTNGIGIYYVEIIGINGKLVFSSFE